MKNTKKSLTAVIVTAIALFASVNVSASQSKRRYTQQQKTDLYKGGGIDTKVSVLDQKIGSGDTLGDKLSVLSSDIDDLKVEIQNIKKKLSIK